VRSRRCLLLDTLGNATLPAGVCGPIAERLGCSTGEWAARAAASGLVLRYVAGDARAVGQSVVHHREMRQRSKDLGVRAGVAGQGKDKTVKKVLIAVAAVAWLVIALPALAHTKGGQTISALPYPPIATGIFMATADTNCTNGAYGEVRADGTHTGACVTSDRTIRIRVGERKCLNPPGCTSFTQWVYSAYVSKGCDKTNNHCKNNATTIEANWDCVYGSIHQYRTSANAGYKGASGTWYWTGWKLSNPVYGAQCA
jgi:hypothetical protein